MDDLISRQAAIEAINDLPNCPNGFSDVYDKSCIIGVLEQLPSAQPERKKGKKFIEIITTYPTICTYPEYKGKPYFSIRYEENGEKFEGFGTYKPEVLSGYISEYFMGADGAERKRGKWIKMSDADGSYYACSECGEEIPRVPDFNPQFDLFPRLRSLKKTKFCSNCGADLRTAP